MHSEDDAWVNQIHTGDVRAVLDDLPAHSIHSVICSPPYWSLRDYDHEDQLGLEPTVEHYVEQLVQIGQQIRRVLRPDGSWWLNLGDTYAGGGGVTGTSDDHDDRQTDEHSPTEAPASHSGFDRKCKLALPHRVAIALIDDGWMLRSDAVWAKTAPMPSSVKDRLNETKEFVFHLTPQPDYWFDLDAIRELHAESSIKRDEYGYTSAGGQAMQCPREDREEQVTLDDDQGLHPNGKIPAISSKSRLPPLQTHTTLCFPNSSLRHR